MQRETQPPRKNPAALARGLMRACERAALATALATPSGIWPYGSLVLAACDQDASPLLLLSALAEHTKNLSRDPNASLLFDGTTGRDDPLTGERATVLGTLAPVADAYSRERFLRRHPTARTYAGFADFRLFRMSVTRAHLVAGFGRIDWIEAAELLFSAETSWLRVAEGDILEHMNRDHAAVVDLYAARLLGRSGTGWQITGVDAEGCDLRCGGAVARLDFPAPVTNLSAVQKFFAALAQSARHRDAPP
jgi:heme oxygenase (biliverdin-IX-beta and delta-forming)